MANGKSKRRTYGTPDDDIPEMTIADFRKARPVREVMPGLIAAAKRARGRPRSTNPKQHISIRLDAQVIAGFKAMGPGWHGRINEALVRALARPRASKPLRATRQSRAA